MMDAPHVPNSYQKIDVTNTDLTLRNTVTTWAGLMKAGNTEHSDYLTYRYGTQGLQTELTATEHSLFLLPPGAIADQS